MKQSENLVELPNGQKIDRADVAFTLSEHQNDKTLLRAFDGTVYKKFPDGSLRRLTPKKKEKLK